MNIAIVLSGGTGSRINSDIPKQYLRVGGEAVITRCLRTLYGHPGIDRVQIVAAYKWREEIIREQEKLPFFQEKFRGFSAPGESRQESVLHALTDLENDAKPSDTVLVHDAARPILTKELVTAVLHAAGEHEGAMPVLTMKDTIYYSADHKKVTQLLERECLYAGQAPEAYRFGPYLKANRSLLPERIRSVHGSTEPAVMAGMDIALLPGDERNFKITTKEDLERFCRMERECEKHED